MFPVLDDIPDYKRRKLHGSRGGIAGLFDHLSGRDRPSRRADDDDGVYRRRAHFSHDDDGDEQRRPSRRQGHGYYASSGRFPDDHRRLHDRHVWDRGRRRRDRFDVFDD